MLIEDPESTESEDQISESEVQDYVDNIRVFKRLRSDKDSKIDSKNGHILGDNLLTHWRICYIVMKRYTKKEWDIKRSQVP